VLTNLSHARVTVV